MAKESSKEVRDNGTPELSQRRQVIPRLKGGSGYDYTLHVVDSDGVDKMLLKGLIDTNQHATLNSFMVMLHRANMLGPKSPSLEKSSGSDPAFVSGKVAEAMAGVSQVIRHLDKRIGPYARRTVMDMCLLGIETSDPKINEYIRALAEGIDMVYDI